MRVRTLEIRWHGGDPIYACDFQPLPQNALKKLIAPRISQKDSSTPAHQPSSSSAPPLPTSAAASSSPPTSQAFRFATAGSDNVVRIWMIHPNMLPPTATSPASTSQPPPNPPPPRAEYLATLRKHTGAVNVARFSPNGEHLASAGDDGWIIVWTLTDRPVTTFGADPEEAQYEKEHWKPIVTIKSTSREVYDLAWSPNGEYILAGSTDNTARIYNASDSTCVREITEHNHYVQGVAWDPLNEFLASQSSDRAVHVYSMTTKRGPFEVHAIGKNSRLSVKHSRTPSGQPSGRTHSRRRGSTSDAESVMTTASEMKEEQYSARMPTPSSTAATPSVAPITIASTPITTAAQLPAPPTPSGSITSTPSIAMFPKPQSRRSSFSGSNAPSPAHSARHMGRSPSPMPPLPAIRAAPATSSWANFKMYGDESYTNFFRRLTFSPDGAFLLTPAGHFEDPTVYPSSSSRSTSSKVTDDPPVRPKKSSKASKQEGGSKSSVYIYSRANFSRPPVAHLPGHQKASVAVKFSPLLYELRPGVTGAEPTEIKKIAVERGKDQIIDLHLGGGKPEATIPSPMQPPLPAQDKAVISSASSDTDWQSVAPSTPATGSVFALPYRMLYAVATQDTVMIYDTQQAGPVCMFTNLHYTSFTDMAWAPDGQSLMLASSDGYCTIIVFDEILPLYHTQQHNLQLQSIAQSHTISPQHSAHGTSAHGHSASQSSLLLTPHSPALSISSSLPPVSTPGPANSMGTPLKRSDRSSSISSVPRTPSSSTALGMENLDMPDLITAPTSAVESAASEPDIQPPAKKKRRIALTHHPDNE